MSPAFKISLSLSLRLHHIFRFLPLLIFIQYLLGTFLKPVYVLVKVFNSFLLVIWSVFNFVLISNVVLPLHCFKIFYFSFESTFFIWPVLKVNLHLPWLAYTLLFLLLLFTLKYFEELEWRKYWNQKFHIATVSHQGKRKDRTIGSKLFTNFLTHVEANLVFFIN